jgi:hypothetical protein
MIICQPAARVWLWANAYSGRVQATFAHVLLAIGIRHDACSLVTNLTRKFLVKSLEGLRWPSTSAKPPGLL